MKNDTNATLNKLISYAIDNLLLDSLDSVYTLNRLAGVTGAKNPVLVENADYGGMGMAELTAELKAVAPNADTEAIKDILFPMPRTVNYYMEEELARGADKAKDFLFELYASGGYIPRIKAFGADGYTAYCVGTESAAAAVALEVGDDRLVYTPIALGAHVAKLENPDILSDDMAAREAAFVSAYGGAIAVIAGESYLCCDAIALESAAVKKQISAGAVKTALLDYPVPAVAVSGIAKNAVTREAVRIYKAAAEAGQKCVLAAAAKDGITFYIVFCGDMKADATGLICGSDALASCGVFRTIDCTPVLSVLEKGMALSTDLAPYKAIYDKKGGVKLGKAKAEAALGAALAEIFKPILAASATLDERSAVALAETK